MGEGLTPLEYFILENEPAKKEWAEIFRTDLIALVNWVADQVEGECDGIQNS